MITVYNTVIEILLEPSWCQVWPTIKIGIDDKLETIVLDKPTWFTYTSHKQAGSIKLSVELCNKEIEHSQQGQDLAVIVKTVKVNNIEDPKIVWQGLYTPIYPEPWATEQEQQGNKLSRILKHNTYLGWNGVWELDIEIPAFMWLHKILDLGWIYD